MRRSVTATKLAKQKTSAAIGALKLSIVMVGVATSRLRGVQKPVRSAAAALLQSPLFLTERLVVTAAAALLCFIQHQQQEWQQRADRIIARIEKSLTAHQC